MGLWLLLQERAANHHTPCAALLKITRPPALRTSPNNLAKSMRHLLPAKCAAHADRRNTHNAFAFIPSHLSESRRSAVKRAPACLNSVLQQSGLPAAALSPGIWRKQTAPTTRCAAREPGALTKPARQSTKKEKGLCLVAKPYAARRIKACECACLEHFLDHLFACISGKSTSSPGCSTLRGSHDRAARFGAARCPGIY